jgi:tRNA threonylcarbamoyladenosine biosynthesis protein TsaE
MDWIFTINQISLIAKALWKAGKQKKVWTFYAPMGAGKTTFIHALCKELQVAQTVSSPTFSIINEYKSAVAGNIYHMDWYRLKDEDEAINAGVEEALTSGNLCLVEWPEKATSLLPDDVLNVYIEVLDENTRRLFIPNPLKGN